MAAIRNLFEIFYFLIILDLLDFLLQIGDILPLSKGFLFLFINFAQKLLNFGFIFFGRFFVLQISNFHLFDQFIIILLQLGKIFLFHLGSRRLLFGADITRFCWFYSYCALALFFLQSRAQRLVDILCGVIQKWFQRELAVSLAFFRNFTVTLLHLRIFSLPELSIVYGRNGWIFSFIWILYEINGPISPFWLRLFKF